MIYNVIPLKWFLYSVTGLKYDAGQVQASGEWLVAFEKEEGLLLGNFPIERSVFS